MLINLVVGRGDRTFSVAPYERQARDVPTMIGDAQQGGDEMVVAALVRRVLRLQQEISVLAGDAAETENNWRWCADG